MNATFADLQRLAVIDASGGHLGKVVDLQIDPADWTVKALVVRLERRAAERLGAKRFLAPSLLALKIIHVHAVGDAVLLRETLDELAREVNTSAPA
ncbi:MAG: PRC-barrel domain-containing protein [Deltaproteobacteria bacterium]|nr:PRC-barrel domain-containing protein [Deltaproteobacteria bacterium]